MPDAGDFDHDHQGHDAPRDWASAFAALPPDQPEPDGWQRLQARLPAAAPVRASRWRVSLPVGLAAAASLALAVVVAMRMQPPPATDALATTPVSVPVPAPEPAPPARDTGPDPASPAIAVADNARKDPTPTTAATARSGRPRPGQHVRPSQRPIRTVAQPSDAIRVAASDPPPAASAAAPESQDLEPLYAQSAQLEGLLAMARDERVSNGAAAALTDDLDARVANIDAALAQTGVAPDRRGDLWRERVDTLRQLVGIETTQRLYSARGQQYDAALVSVD